MIKGLGHIGLFTKNIEKSVAFYTEVLGFVIASQVTEPDGTKITMVENYDCTVEIVQLPAYDGFTDGFFNHFSMVVEDILKAKKHLIDKGVVFEMDEPVISGAFNGVKYLMFRGPDGEHLEINEYIRPKHEGKKADS